MEQLFEEKTCFYQAPLKAPGLEKVCVWGWGVRRNIPS